MKSESFSRFTMDPLSVPRIYYEFTILFAISICINYYNREFTMKSLAFSRFTTTSLFAISNWYYQYGSNIFLKNSKFIYNLFHEFNMISFLVTRIHFGFTFLFSISIWINNPFREFTMDQFIITANSLWILYWFREFT